MLPGVPSGILSEVHSAILPDFLEKPEGKKNPGGIPKGTPGGITEDKSKEIPKAIPESTSDRILQHCRKELHPRRKTDFLGFSQS